MSQLLTESSISKAENEASEKFFKFLKLAYDNNYDKDLQKEILDLIKKNGLTSIRLSDNLREKIRPIVKEFLEVLKKNNYKLDSFIGKNTENMDFWEFTTYMLDKMNINDFPEYTSDKPKENISDKPKENISDKPKENIFDKIKENLFDKPKEYLFDKPKESMSDKGNTSSQTGGSSSNNYNLDYVIKKRSNNTGTEELSITESSENRRNNKRK